MSPYRKKIVLALGILFMTLISISMILYAHPNLLEFITAFFLKVFLFMKLKLPALFIGLLLSLKSFFLGLTFFKVLLLGVKRYVIDNVISKNIQEHFLGHLKNPLKQWWKNFDVKKKLLFFVPATIFSIIAVYVAGIGKLINFLGIKTLIIGFFKGLWLVGAKIFYFFTSYIWGAWFTPILEILIFSWILTLLEKIPLLKKFFEKIYGFTSELGTKIGQLLDRFINEPIQRRLRGLGRKLALLIHKSNRKSRIANKEADSKEAE